MLKYRSDSYVKSHSWLVSDYSAHINVNKTLVLTLM